MDPLLAQALSVLGFIPDERLSQEVGIKGLETGLDTETLRILASLAPSEAVEAHQLFENVLKEFGLPALGRADAARVYARAISKQILNAELSPYDGANRLWEASIRVNSARGNEPRFCDLDTFVYAASEIESRPEDVDFFNSEIMKEASTWVDPTPNFGEAASGCCVLSPVHH